MMNLKVKIKQLDTNLELPRYAYAGDAAMDLRASIDVRLEPGQRACIPCGICIEVPKGFAALILPRSGLALKHGISVVNAPGLIDSNYRGEIKAILLNTDNEHSFDISVGDRIAQLMIIEVPKIEFEVVDELSESCRSGAGFGSSGV